MNCTLRVTTADPDVARIWIRRHQFVIGRPIELDEASPGSQRWNMRSARSPVRWSTA